MNDSSALMVAVITDNLRVQMRLTNQLLQEALRKEW